MYNLPPPYNYCQRSPCYSEGDDRIYKKRRMEITGKQRVAANERERKRMNSINRGFDYLRQRLPCNTHEKKLSKVDTLRGAMEYIRKLQAVLEQELPPDESSLYMVSWRRTPEKYGEIHATPRGPVVYQKDVWMPGTQ
ncbi:Helix-loop-helix DNA-binding domain protein [Teladorsagia circumcincta]|uniref:Helix-loop-helix DNA-binding domain protein n=1 Tax=Teladorsagia circumcincta TaxID=45464 RepID=A0A2G9UWN3_TELCI|nr:Helix-loop-helix DNA-binding domain protein [Teladorsagia circumcincta]